ncbi:hydratase [Treponema succinifaciens]|uniref:3-isopropylmalate dehydratase n=1 Tax=Treponema succinifaciens (strain ATCC 33096 / DSM 2489 / 6091) TaxID=869209 RepID=F2NRD9_TRES6|nr:hydratase [Treponema succinifaciens]AEB13481.1 3-isopropylmalate dehydratase [Treponema succinifaciens DSM 2489]
MKLWEKGAFLSGGKLVESVPGKNPAECAKNTISYSILQRHNTSGDASKLKIKFDKITSHDITYVGIIQTARASGLEKFPIPYVLTNCHNSLCAVGGTINEDDHMFGLTCAQKYGGIYVPPHQAVIHQFAREMLAKCGDMILGSDSHTRYGALGTMAIGEGGGELAKQLLGKTYDVNMPGVIAVYLTGSPVPGVGPQDVALAIIKAVFANGYVKNKVMEFVGPGVANLSADFRIGIDVMTTETTCLSSIWSTDEKIREFYSIHGREGDYKELNPGADAYYDGAIELDLGEIRPMIALPFHPSCAYTIEEVNKNLMDVLEETEKRAKVSFGDKVNFTLKNKVIDGKLYVDQGVIAGCAGGGFENICAAADILKGKDTGNGKFLLNVYPASMPVYMELMKNGAFASLVDAGAIVKTAFCGPCFGAGDTPANGALSIRHSTRNFPNREGSKIQNGQLASVALMDARSIAATAANKGFLTAATDLADGEFSKKKYFFDKTIYEKRVYDSKGVAHPEVQIQFGPNIKDWPEMQPLSDDILLKVVSEIHDPVTTTDELIPSGETSSFRSNPLGLAEFTLSRKDPAYVGRAKAVRDRSEEVKAEVSRAEKILEEKYPEFKGRIEKAGLGSTIYAVKPGDGSAREQAASCQRVLGAAANIASDYATKRYRSNLINWGMIPFLYKQGESQNSVLLSEFSGENSRNLLPSGLPFANGDYIFVPGAKKMIAEKLPGVKAYAVRADGTTAEFDLATGDMTDDERKIIQAGCLINFYRG